MAETVSLEEGLRRATLPVTVRFEPDPEFGTEHRWWIWDREMGLSFGTTNLRDAHLYYASFIARAAARVAQL